MRFHDAWRSCVAILEGVGLDPRQACRPGVGPAQIADAELRLGFTLTTELRELYELADGMTFVEGVGGHSLPGLDFPSLDESVTATLMCRENSAGLERLWRPSWFRAFHFDHAVHWAVDVATGVVWFVDWQEDDIYPTAADLATFLRLTAKAASAAHLHYERDGGYFAEPDGMAWAAPHSPLTMI